MVIDQIKAKELFLQALDRQQSAERDRFLCEACGDDLTLRKQVDVLLAADARAGSFLEQGAVATIDQPSERIGTLIGRYKLLEQVGEGGMGVVYVAEQTEPVRRRVALKIIKPGMDTKQVIARFEAERQALAMMDHPNIARVLDAGTTEAGRPYFVMELVRGMPITEYCDKARLSPRQRLELFIDVCQAVQHAHQKGIIHRDLKPSNVMVTMQDGRPIVKVIDFGVAKAVGQQLTERTVYTALTQLVGTPLYMSPEQAELTNHDVDTRSDIYSLGVLLYELLTGQTPFDKEALSKAGFDEMRRMIREDEPLRPSRRFSTLGAAAISTASQHRGVDERQLSRILTGELDWIVMKALEKDRGRRYESASALATDIQRYLSDEPVLACPPTTMYRFQKFARKHKPALVTAAAIAVCLVLGTTVSAWQAARAATAEAQANANEAQAKDAAAAETKQRQRAEANEQKANTQRDEAQKQRDEVKALADRLQRTLYASHMNLAQHAWDSNNFARVNDLLNQQRPKPGDTDLRGFEWYYLYRLCHAELLTFKGDIAAFSPDGKRLVSTSNDYAVNVWDAQTGQQLLVFKGHTSRIRSVDFSPDGKRLASASAIFDTTQKAWVAGEVKVWDVQTGQELLSLKTNPVNSVTFSPDGKRLASVGSRRVRNDSKPGEVKVWHAQTGQELLSFQGNNVAFSPDGKRLAYGVDGELRDGKRLPGQVKVRDAQTGEELLTLAGGGDSVTYSPDGQSLASSVGRGGAKVWNAQTGQELFSIQGEIWSMAFSPDSKRLGSASLDHKVRVWDVPTGQELLTINGGGDGLAFSQDGKRLASGSGDRTVKVWDAETGQELFTFTGHSNNVNNVAFSPDGTRLVSAAPDMTVKVWDLTTNSQDARTFRKLGDKFATLAYSPDGKRLAIGAETSGAEELKVWDAVTGQELLALKWDQGGAALIPVFSPDGKRLAGAGGGVRVWDAQTGQDLLTLKGHTGVYSVAYSPDGKRLASAGYEGTVKVWDAGTGQELTTLKGLTDQIYSVAFSPDGKRLASASRGPFGGASGELKVWDAETGQELLTLQGKTEGFPCNVAFSPDGKRLAGGINFKPGEAGVVQVWDAQTGNKILTLPGHTHAVRSVAFSPDGKRLASGSDQWRAGHPENEPGEIKVWDGETGQELLTFSGGSNCVTFSPDGHHLACNAGGAVKIYDATPLPENP